LYVLDGFNHAFDVDGVCVIVSPHPRRTYQPVSETPFRVEVDGHGGLFSPYCRPRSICTTKRNICINP